MDKVKTLADYVIADVTPALEATIRKSLMAHLLIQDGPAPINTSKIPPDIIGATPIVPDKKIAAAPKTYIDMAPDFFKAAMKEIGIRETGNNAGPDVERYIKLAHCGAVGDPWCAIFANAMLESTGHIGTKSPAARSFENNPNFTKLDAPRFGCIVTFWRGTKDGGKGHVGFFNGETASTVSVLGGNESDRVKVEDLPKASASFGLLGYYWPKALAIPLRIPTSQKPLTYALMAPQLPSGIGGKVT